MGRLRRSLLGGATLLIAAQCVRVSRINPPVGSDLVAPAEVHNVLRAACYDCHSNETRWPWYSTVAPVSWWVLRHVNEGRRRLNFSDWDAYASDPDTVAQKLGEIATFVRNGEMAPWYYRALYPLARLSAEQRDLVVRWTDDEARRLTQAH